MHSLIRHRRHHVEIEDLRRAVEAEKLRTRAFELRMRGGLIL